MAHTATVSGPDLAAGVPLSSVPTQGMILGHVDATPVLLVRREDGIFAVSATCSHYGGPLAEGLVVDDEIRCPWHHACFSLRTGAALRAPAFSSLDTWQVDVVDERVFVRAQATPASAPGQAPRTQPERIVIIGGGAAGFAAAERLRELGFAGSLSMLSADAAAPYDRPNLSKDYLAGTAPEDWIPLQGEEFYAQRRIDLRLQCEVAAIDTASRHVVTRKGERFAYDALLIATGAEPLQLKIPGFDRSNVFVLRSLADASAIIAATDGARSVALVGAGFIGLEAAGALRTRGLEVHVVAREELPMATVLGPQLASVLVGLHEQHGVVFHLHSTVRSFDGHMLTLGDGAHIDADLVIVGVGVTPRTVLGFEAGLEIDDGILVDAQLQTSVPDIYAAGDVARYRHGDRRLRIEHWVHAQRQGQAAAGNMLGTAQAFSDVPFFWTNHYGLDLRYSGYGDAWDEVVVDGQPTDHDCMARFFSADQLVAAASLGRDLENLLIEAELRR